MQRKHVFYILWLLFYAGIYIYGSPAYCQTLSTESNTAYRQLQRSLYVKDFFSLSKQLHLLKQQVSPAQQLYFQAYLDNVFNRNQQAVQHIDSLLNNFASELQDSSIAQLYLLKGECYFKLFEYAKAAESDSIVLNKYRSAIDSNKVADVDTKLTIYNGLRNIPPQQTSIASNAMFRWKRNKIGIVEIPLGRQDTTYDAVFDTRANISTITQTYAAKLGLQALPVFYYEGSGITGIRFKTGLAIADSLYLGDILIQHAVFQVVPDSVLYIAPVDFQLNIIVGFPIIEQLREVHFYKEGRMEIPVHAAKSKLQNLVLDGLNPVVALRTDSGDTLPFGFDFGANKSVLFTAYFQKYKQRIIANGVKTTTEYSGAGGAQQKEVLMLPFVDLYLGEKKVRLDSIDVLSEKIYPEETFYGNIGQDLINVFKELVINFQTMYIEGL